MTESKKTTNQLLPFSANFRGRLHQANLALFLTYGAIVIVIFFLARFVLPAYPSFALFFLAILIVTLVGTVIITCIRLSRMDPTERMSIRQDTAGLMVSARYPSVIFLQFIQFLTKASPKPTALIPEGVDPKSDPSKFKQLTAEESKRIVTQEVEEALSGTVSSIQNLAQETPDVAGTATIDPQKCGPSKETIP